MGALLQPAILAGGSGTRLWPLSTPQFPKPFLKLHPSGRSFFQETVLRTEPLGKTAMILCNRQHLTLAQSQLDEIQIQPRMLFLEPEPRNTAAAIAIAALYNPHALLLILPSDHIIQDTPAFISAVHRAESLAQKGYLVTFGIPPECPEIGYGYICKGKNIGDTEGFHVARFTEKPDIQTATRYLATGEYLWNSGIFLFPAEILISELAIYQPPLLAACKESLANAQIKDSIMYLEEESFTQAPALPIDRALMEHTKKAACMPFRRGWQDIGSWQALNQLSAQTGT